MQRKKLSMIRIKLPAKGITLMLKPNCNGNPCTVVIRSNDFAMPKNRRQLFEIKAKGNVGSFKPFHNSNSKELSLFISMHGYNYSYGKRHNISINLSLEVFATGCFYWNKLKSSWSSDGCRVRKYFATYDYTLPSHMAADTSVLSHSVRVELFAAIWVRDRVCSFLLFNSLMSALIKKPK